MNNTSRLMRTAVFGLPLVKSSFDSISGFKSRSEWIVIAATSVPVFQNTTIRSGMSFYNDFCLCFKCPPSISTFAAAMPVGAQALAFFPCTIHHR